MTEEVDKIQNYLFIASGVLGLISLIIIIAVVILLVYMTKVDKKVKDLKVFTESYISGNNFKGIPRVDTSKDKPTSEDFQHFLGTGKPEPPDSANNRNRKMSSATEDRQWARNEPPQAGFIGRQPPPSANMGRNPMGTGGARRDDDIGTPSWQGDNNQSRGPNIPNPSSSQFTFGRPIAQNNYDRGVGLPNYDRPMGFERSTGPSNFERGVPRPGSNFAPSRPGRIGY